MMNIIWHSLINLIVEISEHSVEIQDRYATMLKAWLSVNNLVRIRVILTSLISHAFK